MNDYMVKVLSLRARASALAIAALFGLSLGLSGCKGDAGPAGAAGSAAATQQATGTIQGGLVDSVTYQPIVGAVMDIGVAKATTNENGEFAFYNVPVPVDANNNAMAPRFRMIISMKGVTSPVNMANAAASPRYADNYGKVIELSFTPLYTAGSSVTAVPVTGLVATTGLMVGKLAASISGTVADSVTKQAVGAGYTVKLVSTSPDFGTSGTGALENVVGSTTTNASGNFSFANIESLKDFRIDAWNTTQTMRGSKTVTSPADGETRTLAIQNNNGAVLVASTDALPPTIISVTPELNADIAPTGGVNVVFTFSEQIKQTADTGSSANPPTASASTGLYNTVAVNYMGAKASNISHSLSWNAAMTQLTVSIPTLAEASKYQVSLAGTGTTLKDLSGNTVTNIATVGEGVLDFTTNGSATPTAPTIALVSPLSIDFNSALVNLDWMPVSGAKSYNVYRAQNYPSAAGQLQKVGSVLSSAFSDPVPASPIYSFVSGQNKLTYSYVVTSVSADNIESLGSAPVTAEDMVKPTAGLFMVTPTEIMAVFNEPVDEASATALTNYSLLSAAPPLVATTLAITSVALTSPTTVLITVPVAVAAGNYLSVSGVKDIAGNTMTAAAGVF